MHGDRLLKCDWQAVSAKQRRSRQDRESLAEAFPESVLAGKPSCRCQKHLGVFPRHAACLQFLFRAVEKVFEAYGILPRVGCKVRRKINRNRCRTLKTA